MLNLNVLYLNQIQRATQTDINNGLVYWADLFKANTWEELRRVASKKPEFKEVADIMYESNLIQSQERTLFEAHQKFLRDRASARHEGYTEGFDKGVKDGIKQGIEQGIEQGIAQAKAETKEEIDALKAEIDALKATIEQLTKASQ